MRGTHTFRHAWLARMAHPSTRAQRAPCFAAATRVRVAPNHRARLRAARARLRAIARLRAQGVPTGSRRTRPQDECAPTGAGRAYGQPQGVPTGRQARPRDDGAPSGSSRCAPDKSAHSDAPTKGAAQESVAAADVRRAACLCQRAYGRLPTPLLPTSSPRAAGGAGHSSPRADNGRQPTRA